MSCGFSVSRRSGVCPANGDDAGYCFGRVRHGDRDPGTAYLPRSKLAFYSLDNGVLSAWLIDRTGLITASHADLTSQQLTEATLDLRLLLNVDGIARSRSVRLRSAAPPASSSRGRLRRGLDQLSALLLPKPSKEGLRGTDH